jgi:hypothetical protein
MVGRFEVENLLGETPGPPGEYLVVAISDGLAPSAATAWISCKMVSAFARADSCRHTGLVWAPFCTVAHDVSAFHPLTKQVLNLPTAYAVSCSGSTTFRTVSALDIM